VKDGAKQHEALAIVRATVAALERKVGQLTMELDVLNKGYPADAKRTIIAYLQTGRLFMARELAAQEPRSSGS